MTTVTEKSSTVSLSNQIKPILRTLTKAAQKGKTTPRKEKELNFSYAKPTLSSKFKSVKKTVNRLAKYRPTKKSLGLKRAILVKPINYPWT